MEAIAKGENAYEVGETIFNRSGILAVLLHDTTPESISKQENLQELLSGLKDFVVTREESGEQDRSLSAFLSEVQLSTDQDENEDDGDEKVTLMTVHAAKGLEFKHIYIVGVEEELFPAAMSMDSMAQVEEERRLLYVAITRAKETCVMTYATSRFRNGQTVMTRPSRFLGDIDTRYLKIQTSSDIGNYNSSASFINPSANFRRNEAFSNVEIGGFSRGRGKSRSVFNFYSSGSGNKVRVANAGGTAESRKEIESKHGRLAVGMEIMHDRFGKGTIQKIEHMTDNDMIIVDFGVVGIKKLLIGFAKFTVI